MSLVLTTNGDQPASTVKLDPNSGAGWNPEVVEYDNHYIAREDCGKNRGLQVFYDKRNDTEKGYPSSIVAGANAIVAYRSQGSQVQLWVQKPEFMTLEVIKNHIASALGDPSLHDLVHIYTVKGV